MTDKDTPVDGAEPRPDELVDALDEVKSTPPDTESGNEWPDIGQPGGVENTRADHGVTSEEDRDGNDPNLQTGGGQFGG